MSMAVLTFDQEGVGSCLYTELIDLQVLGALEVSRASRIEFNNETQKWEVMDLQGKMLFSSKFRQVCLEWERQNVSKLESRAKQTSQSGAKCSILALAQK